MNTNKAELNLMELEGIHGGITHKNPTPDRYDRGIDQILNGKTYDWIAQKIADWLNGDTERSRKVNNKVDIYDTDI